MRALIVVLGLLSLVAGCTSDPAPPSAPPSAPVAHPPAPRVPDRDEKAVLGTLVNLDPCLLAGFGDAHRRSPHMCIVDLPDHSSVHVTVADRYPRAGRFAGGKKEIGGATVDGISVLTSDLCRAEVPVSFDYAITIDLLPYPSRRGCKANDIDKYAAKVVGNLRKLTTVQHPANRPDLSKEACTVLENAVATVGTKIAEGPSNIRTTIDDCYASGLYGGGMTIFSMLIEPGPPDGGWGTKWATVAGKTIYYKGDGDCRWTWSQGTYSGDHNRLMTLSVDDCKGTKAQMTAVLGALIKELEKPQVPGTVARLTYRPDEPDEPNPGACVDYPQDECEPYQPTPLPANVTVAARTDGHVLCAATLDAVNARFPGMRPVTDQLGCSYVRPDHAVQLDFRVWGNPSAALDPSVSRKVAVAGHPGVYAETRAERQPPQTSVCVDPGKQDPKTSQPYYWCVVATFRVPRNTDGKADPSRQTELEPLMAEVAKHF
ncbi:hypothetical protein EV186_101959 [Labedaea rhizosphaerae]|uniref:Uncharacterized protein n=1 Tax=Labedaea rhizosphaerae TaxID=598644 RepID=A0A4V3D0A2_LABRH|nr:hypothetical protein EV186_101959 [Labedaea rhizosphaerae]